MNTNLDALAIVAYAREINDPTQQKVRKTRGIVDLKQKKIEYLTQKFKILSFDKERQQKYDKIFEHAFNVGKTMKTLETYFGLCTEVYELSKPNAPSDAYAFYREYARAASGPILEPMCGTGRFLLPLLEEGFNVHGFDASSSMLAKLYEKAKTKKLEPNVWHGFAEDLNRPEKYKLIFIPSGSFCLMIDLEEVKTALKKFYDHLNNGGIFLFEAETLAAVPQLGSWRGSVWPKSNDQIIILSHLATMKDNICTSVCKYELGKENHVINTEIEELKVRIYEQDQLVAMLKAAGFQSIRILKAFNVTAQPDTQDESVLYECRK
jgi:SAM-dependent methyltransferase